jgi:hypothetical protein
MATLKQALDLIAKANREHLYLQLWGSVACEYHSPSWNKLGFHHEHVDADFMAKPAQKPEFIRFMQDQGFTVAIDHVDEHIMEFEGPEFWVEVIFGHMLDDETGPVEVTVPLENMVWRCLYGLGRVYEAYQPYGRSREAYEHMLTRPQDLAALLIDHEIVEESNDPDTVSLKHLTPILQAWYDTRKLRIEKQGENIWARTRETLIHRKYHELTLNQLQNIPPPDWILTKHENRQLTHSTQLLTRLLHQINQQPEINATQAQIIFALQGIPYEWNVNKTCPACHNNPQIELALISPGIEPQKLQAR